MTKAEQERAKIQQKISDLRSTLNRAVEIQEQVKFFIASEQALLLDLDMQEEENAR